MIKRVKKSGIYRIRNILNDNCYVGSSKDIENRYYTHVYDLRRNQHHSTYLQNAWNKYGEENFVLETVEECEATKEKLLEREQFYFDANWPVYNMLPRAGSRLGSKSSEETKAKQAKSMIGKNVGKTHTPEMRASMLITHKHTDESKAKLSAAHSGKVHGEETKRKMSEAHIGYAPKAESITKTTENRSRNRLAKIALSIQNIEPSKTCSIGNAKKRKLTEDNVREIRNSGLMDKDLASQFDVTPTVIRRIRLLRSYKDVV
jgi:group I intron endonuclease